METASLNRLAVCHMELTMITLNINLMALYPHETWYKINVLFKLFQQFTVMIISHLTSTIEHHGSTILFGKRFPLRNISAIGIPIGSKVHPCLMHLLAQLYKAGLIAGINIFRIAEYQWQAESMIS